MPEITGSLTTPFDPEFYDCCVAVRRYSQGSVAVEAAIRRALYLINAKPLVVEQLFNTLADR